MSLATPETIRTLQRKLYAKAKQEPAYRFYALYDKLSRADVLAHAWRLVRTNRGGPGVDGVSFEAIEHEEGVEGFLRELMVIPLTDVVANMNRSLRGWVNYFHYRNSSGAMHKVRQHAEQRLRTHLRKRHKIRHRKTGFVRFPPRDLYERYGLYHPPMKAGWSSAHAVA